MTSSQFYLCLQERMHQLLSEFPTWVYGQQIWNDNEDSEKLVWEDLRSHHKLHN